MGRVYLGRSPDDVIVAVKVIQPGWAAHPHFLERFRREMRAAEALGDGYAASLVGCDPDARAPWLATKFIVGRSLADLVAPVRDGDGPRPLDVGAVWWLAFGLIKALTEMHACHIVHRDLKPANVVMASDGPKVIDFGVALGLANSVLSAPRLTAVGQRVGTEAFMSPEQLNLLEIGPASDIYSLGIVLVYAATGIVPERIAHGRVQRNGPGLASVPPDLVPLIQRCLRTRPDDRADLTELLSIVLAGKRQYPQAVPSFWPQPMASRVVAAADQIKRDLPSTVARNLPSVTDHAGWEEFFSKYGRPYPTLRETKSDTPVSEKKRPAETLRLPLPLDDELFHAYRPNTGAAATLNGPNDPADAAAYLLDAEDLWRNGNYRAAEDAYRASLKLSPDNAPAHVDLGCLLWDQSRYKHAKDSFRAALRCSPALVAAHRNLFIVTKNEGGNGDLASFLRNKLLQTCEAVLTRDAENASDYANRGDAFICLGQADEAEEAYRMALTYDEANLRLLRKLDYVTRRLSGM